LTPSRLRFPRLARGRLFERDHPERGRRLAGPLKAGIEPFAENPQVAENKQTTQEGERGYTQIRAQIEKPLEPDLTAVVAAWPSLSAPLKAAIVAIANTATNKGGQ